MDRQFWLGVISGLVGISAGAALSAYQTLHPEAAGDILTAGLLASGALLIAGFLIALWPRSGVRGGQRGISVKMRDHNQIGRIGNDNHG